MPMPHDPTANDPLWSEALDHVLALGASPQDAARRRAAEAWRAADPAHDAAFREAEKVWSIAGHAQPAHAASWQRQPTPLRANTSRRRLLAGGAALAAGIAGIALFSPARHWLGDETATGTRETRRIALADGSEMVLGPDSVAAIRFTDAVRRIELRAGVAYFSVTKDAARPFEVLADDITVRVVGTAFEVKRVAGKVGIAVTEGLVDVLDTAQGSSFGPKLGAGDWMVVDTATHEIERGKGDAQSVAAWRDGFLVVENRPISELVEEIAHWHDGAIFLLDDDLGRRRVSGTLDLGDPKAALAAMLSLYGGKVDSVTPWALFITTAP